MNAKPPPPPRPWSPFAFRQTKQGRGHTSPAGFSCGCEEGRVSPVQRVLGKIQATFQASSFSYKLLKKAKTLKVHSVITRNALEFTTSWQKPAQIKQSWRYRPSVREENLWRKWRWRWRGKLYFIKSPSCEVTEQGKSLLQTNTVPLETPFCEMSGMLG